MGFYTGPTFKYTRSTRFGADELAAINEAGVYVNDKPYLFEVGQEVVVTNINSRLFNRVGTISKRRGGSPARYIVRFGLVSIPFLETELVAYRALPVPLWMTQGKPHQIDRVIVFGREFPADSEIAARLMKRQGDHNRRQATKRLCHDTICLPKWTQSTAREAVRPLVERWRNRRAYIERIEWHLQRQTLARAA